MVRGIAVCAWSISRIGHLAIRGDAGTPILPFAFQELGGNILRFGMPLTETSTHEIEEQTTTEHEENAGGTLFRESSQ